VNLEGYQFKKKAKKNTLTSDAKVMEGENEKLGCC
jgi:hypothetical protein